MQLYSLNQKTSVLLIYRIAKYDFPQINKQKDSTRKLDWRIILNFLFFLPKKILVIFLNRSETMIKKLKNEIKNKKSGRF